MSVLKRMQCMLYGHKTNPLQPKLNICINCFDEIDEAEFTDEELLKIFDGDIESIVMYKELKS